ncbi:MAG: LPP20 family lipoprotein [Gammaproteobacteria bacterium]
MKMKITATLVLGLLLTACGSKQPEWLDKPTEEYPQQRYLSAVGEADDRSTADGRALANLAKIFEVAIKDRSLDFSQAQVSADQSGRAVSNTQATSRYVTTEAKQVLEGAQLVESWQAEEGKTYALAVLEKAPAERRFRDGVRSADRQIEDRVNYASQQAPNPVVALAALEQARKIEHQRSNLNRNLSVVSGKGIKAYYDQASLEKLLRNALVILHFHAMADSPQLQQNLESAIGALGITLDKNAPYTLMGSIDTEPVQLKQGWYWLRGSTELSLIYQGEALAKKRWPLKVSATDKGMVEQRAKDKLSQQMTTYLYELITSVQ